MTVYRTLLGMLLGALLLAPWRPAAQAAGGSATQVACVMRQLTTQGKIGQILMVGVSGTRPTGAMTGLLRSWRAGGVILSGSNVGSAGDLNALIAGLQHAAPLPLLVATDQEGGEVARIQVGLVPLPSEAYYGSIGSSAKVLADTRAQGVALKALGINLNLAPVVDVLENSASAIGSRSFGPNAALDGTLAAAAIRGYQSAGIGATAKHFLGLGSVTADADYALPVVTESRAALEAGAMVPMRAAVKAGVAALMVTRVLIPAFDPVSTAYASSAIVQGIIRHELGFKGMIITDSLVSSAVLSGPGAAAAAVAALRAGDEMLLLGGGGFDSVDTQLAIGAIRAAVANGSISMTRLDDALTHVLQLKAQLRLLPHC